MNNQSGYIPARDPHVNISRIIVRRYAFRAVCVLIICTQLVAAIHAMHFTYLDLYGTTNAGFSSRLTVVSGDRVVSGDKK